MPLNVWASDNVGGRAIFYEKSDAYAVDDRALAYYFMFSSVKHIGAGQFLSVRHERRARLFLDGGNNYRLTVPANIRVQQYWSAVVYDCASHAFTRDLFGKRPLPTFRFYGELTRSSTRRSNCRILRWSSRKAAETGCDDAPIRSSGAA